MASAGGDHDGLPGDEGVEALPASGEEVCREDREGIFFSWISRAPGTEASSLDRRSAPDDDPFSPAL